MMKKFDCNICQWDGADLTRHNKSKKHKLREQGNIFQKLTINDIEDRNLYIIRYRINNKDRNITRRYFNKDKEQIYKIMESIQEQLKDHFLKTPNEEFETQLQPKTKKELSRCETCNCDVSDLEAHNNTQAHKRLIKAKNPSIELKDDDQKQCIVIEYSPYGYRYGSKKIRRSYKGIDKDDVKAETEDLKQSIIDHFKENPFEPYTEAIDDMKYIYTKDHSFRVKINELFNVCGIPTFEQAKEIRHKLLTEKPSKEGFKAYRENLKQQWIRPKRLSETSHITYLKDKNKYKFSWNYKTKNGGSIKRTRQFDTLEEAQKFRDEFVMNPTSYEDFVYFKVEL